VKIDNKQEEGSFVGFAVHHGWFLVGVCGCNKGHTREAADIGLYILRRNVTKKLIIKITDWT
jgi:hypothetical protein